MERVVLTPSSAKSLIGLSVKTFTHGYGSQFYEDEFVIGEVISELDYYRRDVDFHNIDPRFNNRAEYWESYMNEEQLDSKRNKMLLITDEGRNTNIFAFGDGLFCCSDADRVTYFEVLD